MKKNTTKAAFQGNLKSKNYFEGWYIKLVTKDRTRTMSFIPGISLTGDANTHSFIQFIDGNNGYTKYFNYEIKDFDFCKDYFDISIGDCNFSHSEINLNIQEYDFKIEGEISFSKLKPYKKKFLSPNIMGFFSYLPFMECNHGLVSYDHDLFGQLLINGERIDFNEGKGYIEKDWGTSMPTDWIWMQTNSFASENTSFMLSVAKVPFLQTKFVGFLGFLMIENQVIHFATYNGSRIKNVMIIGNNVTLDIFTKKFKIQIFATRKNSYILSAPVKGNMVRTISESLDSEIEVKLFNKKNELMYSGVGYCAGLEIVGDIASKQ